MVIPLAAKSFADSVTHRVCAQVRHNRRASGSIDLCVCARPRARAAPTADAGAAFVVRYSMGVQFLLAVLLPVVAAHSNLIKPKPRNAIDSELAEWKDGNAPYMWVPNIGKVATICMHFATYTPTTHTRACPAPLTFCPRVGRRPLRVQERLRRVRLCSDVPVVLCGLHYWVQRM
eukprot:COSAG02_NODE_1642_length_11529_cov_4.449606_2_plen_175_part_00